MAKAPSVSPFSPEAAAERSGFETKKEALRKRLVTATLGFETLAVPENLGRLALVTPTAFTEGVETRFGRTDAITADIVILDGDGAPHEMPGSMIFQKFMVGQLKPHIGKQPVLGRVAKQKSAKGHDAWVLDAESLEEADLDLAAEYLDEQEKAAKRNRFSTAKAGAEE